MTRWLNHPVVYCVSVLTTGATSLAFAETSISLTEAVFPAGEERCFAQSFTPKRKGQVTDLYVYRLLRPNPAFETIEDSPAKLAEWDKEYPDYRNVSVIARYNDVAGSFTQSASCRDHEGHMICGVDCDGGSFAAKQKGSKLAVDFSEYGMVVQGGCGSDDETEETRMLKNSDIPAKAELAPRPLGVCLEADKQAGLSFARELVSLRERIQTLGWTCLKRSYVAAHLAKNPKQNVKSIAVNFNLEITPGEERGTDVVLAARAHIKTRDGSEAVRSFKCYGGQYEFTCDEEFRLKRRDNSSALLYPGSFTAESPNGRQLLGLVIGEGDDVFKLDAKVGGACVAP